MPSHKLNGTTPGDYTPVLQPQDYPNEAFTGGVGSPHILSDPEDQQTKLMFTGWEPGGQGDRDLFVCDINPAFKLSNFQRIYDPNWNLESAYGFYDKTNSEWIIGFTRPASEGLGILVFSRDFSTLESQTLYSVSTKDSGATAFPEKNGGLRLSAVDSSTGDLNIYAVQADFTTRPISGSVSNPHTKIHNGPEYTPDVHHTMWTNDGLAILFENNNGVQQWSIHMAHTGYHLSTTEDIWATPSMRPLISPGTGSDGQYGHPTYSTELGRPVVLYDWFRNYAQVSGNTHRHEIWATEVPWNFTDAHEWFPYRLSFPSDAKIPTDKFMSHGASKMIVYVRTGGSFSFQLIEAASPALLDGGNWTSRSRQVDGNTRLVFDDPLQTLQINSDGNPAEMAVTLKR